MVNIDMSGAAGGVLGTDVLGVDAFTLGGSGIKKATSRFCVSGSIFGPKFSSSDAWFLKSGAWRVQPTGRRA